MPHLTALVALLAVFAYFGVGFNVGRARIKYKIAAPATTGDPAFERIFRTQQNMLEWMPIFLPALFLFGVYVSDRWAAILGLVWIAARILYVVTYAQAAEKRSAGFAIQALASLILMIGALVGIVRTLIA
jgi:glutathione S-transferase